MQKFAKFVSLNYIAGSGPSLVQGIKGGRTPHNAIAGGNGSFVVKGTPSQLILTMKTDEEKYIQLNIINTVRIVLNRSRITEKLCDKLEEVFSSSKFEISDGAVTNLNEIIEKV